MTIDDRLETALRSAYTRHAGDELHELRYEPPMGFSRSRSRWRAPVALTSCAMVIVGLIVLTLVLHGRTPTAQKVQIAQVTPSPSATHPRPPAGTVARLEPVRKALVTADGDTIYTTAIGGGCIRTAILTATETSTEVVLHLNAYTAADKDTGCTLNLIVWTRSTTLATPLDGRRLIDGSTGRAVPYFDGRNLATATWLPKGAGTPINSLGEGWTRTYRFPGQHDAAPIDISQGTTDLLHSDEFRANPDVRISYTHIHGDRAVLVTQSDNGTLLQDRLGWEQDGNTFIVDSQPEYGYQQPFGPDVIERIARGLQLHGSR